MLQGDLLADVPRSRSSDPATSHMAAERIKANGKLGSHQRAVLAAVQAHPGHTSAELADFLTGDPALSGVTDLYHEAARRLPELVAFVRKGEARQCSVRFTVCTTWWPR